MSWFKHVAQPAAKTSPKPEVAARENAVLLQDLKAGSPKAVERWYRLYEPKMRRLIATKVSVAADVDELVQDTFQSCLKHLPLFRGDASIATWMTRIAQHEVADYYRKKYAKKAIRALPLAEFLLLERPHNAHETSERVKEVLKQLPAAYQELLMMKYVDRKKVQEIAAELGRTVKAVESDLFRAREAFRLEYQSISSI